MILPTKHVPANESLIGVGAIILQEIRKPISVSMLWKIIREDESVGTYERFILTLDMLHILGIIFLDSAWQKMFKFDLKLIN